MVMPLDFSGMKKFEPVEKGRYPVVVVSSEIGTSKADKPKWSLQLEIEEGHPKAGQKLFVEHGLSPEALWAVARDHEALTGEKISSETGEFEFNAEVYLGLRSVADVEVDSKYDGTPRNQVKRLFPAASGKPQR